MNIIINVNKQDYQLKNGTGDVVLSRYYGMKEVLVKEEKKMVESTKLVGYFKNTFEALEYIVKDQEHDNDITSILELKKMYINTMRDVRSYAQQLKIEG